MLLLVQALALFVLWVAGCVAERRALRPAYESNARHTHPTISVVTLGWLVLAEQALHLTPGDFRRFPLPAAQQWAEI